jgi:hypothetical protein
VRRCGPCVVICRFAFPYLSDLAILGPGPSKKWPQIAINYIYYYILHLFFKPTLGIPPLRDVRHFFSGNPLVMLLPFNEKRGYHLPLTSVLIGSRGGEGQPPSPLFPFSCVVHHSTEEDSPHICRLHSVQFDGRKGMGNPRGSGFWGRCVHSTTWFLLNLLYHIITLYFECTQAEDS